MFKNKLLWVCILIGLTAAIYINVQRHHAEVATQTVELVMDYEDVVDLSATEGLAVSQLMGGLREAGITSLAVYDMTLEKLNKSGRIFTLSGAELLQRFQTGVPANPVIGELLQSGQIATDRVYVFGPAGQTFQEVREDLQRRLGADRVTTMAQGTTHVLEVKGNYEKLVKWNLGLSTEEMAAVAGNGFHVVPRPTNYAKVTPADVEAVFARIGTQQDVSTLIFVGDEALGYKSQLALTAEHIKNRQLTVGLIEHPTQLQFVRQEGLLPLVKTLDYRAARVYVIPKDEQPKLKIAEAVQRWVLSDRERNIRINLLRPYTKPEGDQTLIETNLRYVRETKVGLENTGFSIGRAGYFEPYFPSRFALSLIILGACAGGVMLLSELITLTTSLRLIVLAVTFLPMAAAVLSGHGNVVRQMAALASAIIFPSVAMGIQIRKWRDVCPASYSIGSILLRAIRDIAIVSMISAVGGLFIAALLGDVRYFLEMEIYRGVKVTFIAPLFIVAILFLKHFSLAEGSNSQEGFVKQAARFLDQPVLFKYLGGLAAMAIIAIIYVGRSGHTLGVPVPAFELKLRALFEELFYARPRTREFLIGHPAFLLAALAFYRGWPRIWQLVLVVFASMAQSSLVETFAHLRTPVLMSFIRGVDGWVVGVILGAATVIVVSILLRAAAHLGRRALGHG